jgi:hypothetical protein
MPRCGVRYLHPEVRDLLKENADQITETVAEVMTTDDRTGEVQPDYVKLELDFAPDDINTRDISVNLEARLLPGRKGRERDIARTVREAFMKATGGRYSVGVWVVLSEHSTYREYVPE